MCTSLLSANSGLSAQSQVTVCGKQCTDATCTCLQQRSCLAGSTAALERDFFRHLDSGAIRSDAASHTTQNEQSYSTASTHHPDASRHHDTQPHAAAATAMATSPILELVLQGQPVAVAIKQQGQPVSSQTHPKPSSSAHGQQQANMQQHDEAERPSTTSAQCAGKSAEPWTCIYAMDGSVLATEQQGNVYKGGASGPHTHTILTGQTPLVRHLHIVTNAQGIVILHVHSIYGFCNTILASAVSCSGHSQ